MGFQVGIEHLRHRPQHTQHEQDADKRRQMGERLEYGHEDKTADTEEEDGLALHRRQFACLHTLRLFCRERQLAFQGARQYVGWYHHRHNRGDEQFGNHPGSRDDALVPEHDRRHIADGRKGTAGIGRDNHQRGIDDTVALIADEFPQDHDHHDRRGQIVENGREKKRHEGDAPQQRSLAARLHRVAHEIETAILVNEFHNRHGSHQEEKRRGGAAQMVLNHLVHRRGNMVAKGRRHVTGGIEHKQRPCGDEHQQGNGCLVDFRHTFDSNEEIADAENDDYRYSQCTHSLNRYFRRVSR